MGRDKNVVWFVEQESILTPEERCEAVDRWWNCRQAVNNEARGFWQKEKADSKPKPKENLYQPPMEMGVSEQHLEAFRSWRRGRQRSFI